MKTKMCFSLLGLLFTSISFGQDYAWSNKTGGAEVDFIYDVAIDGLGNNYAIGFFEGTVDFDPSVELYELTASENRDGFVQKLDEENNLLWVKQFTGTDNIYIRGIAVDGIGGFCLTGNFKGTCDFDPGIATFEMTAVGVKNAFTVKLNELGGFVWAKQIKGTTQTSGHVVSVDQAGNVYTGGDFFSEADLDPGPGELIFNVTGEGAEAFVQKLNSSGDLIWGRQFEGTGFTECHLNSIETDQDENVYLAGYFLGTVDFDPTVTIVSISSVPSETIGLGSRDIFVAKLSPFGDLSWVKAYGGLKHDRATSMALDPSGNVLVTGFFRDTVIFDPEDEFVELTAAGSGFGFGDPGGTDAFVQKFDNSGNLIWIKQMVGDEYMSRGNAIDTDVFGNIYVAGEVNFGTIDFDPNEGEYFLTAVNYGINTFIQKLDDAGRLVWVKQIAGYDSESFLVRPFGIAVSSNSSIAVVGSFQGNIDFDPEESVDNLTSIPEYDGFIIYFSQEANEIIEAQEFFSFVYPNPMKDLVTVSINQPNKTSHISVFDARGQLLYENSSNESSFHN